MTDGKLKCSYYPSRLTYADISALESMATRHASDYPQFCHWLIEVLRGERLRRRNDLPVPKFGVDVDWSGSMLGDALIFCSAATYWPPSHAAGQFMDSLFWSVAAMAATKLREVR